MFVGFIYVERIKGESLADAILTWLETAGLSPSDMRGQCYNGARNMSGATSICRSIVLCCTSVESCGIISMQDPSI